MPDDRWTEPRTQMFSTPATPVEDARAADRPTSRRGTGSGSVPDQADPHARATPRPYRPPADSRDERALDHGRLRPLILSVPLPAQYPAIGLVVDIAPE